MTTPADRHQPTDAAREQLSPAQRALLARRLRGLAASGGNPIPPAPDHGPLPLSDSQRRLWVLHRLQPESPAYNVAVACRLRGPLDTGALQHALSAITRRHEPLRIVIAEQDGIPVQVVKPPQRIVLPVTDLTGTRPAPARLERARALADREAAKPFDPARTPMFRAALARLTDHDHVLSIVMHHLISDAGSVEILGRELDEFYTTARAGRAPRLSPLPVRYTDLARWQGRHQPALEPLLDHWTERLRGAPFTLDLPTDAPRPPVQAHRGQRCSSTLPEPAAARLRTLGRQEGATLFMTLLAGFAVALYRHSGQEDILIGCPIDGRDRIELEGLVGCFVHTLVLRIDLSGEPGFRALLRRVRATVLDAHQHQELPFDRLVEALHPPRDLSRNPLFQAEFVMEHTRVGLRRLGDLAVTDVPIDNRTAKFDLTLFVTDTGASIETLVEYDADLFAPPTAERLLDSMHALLKAAAAQPDTPITALPLTRARARAAAPAAVDTAGPDPSDHCLHELVEAQAARTPEAVALVAGRRQLTYETLDRRAGRLARHLRTLGVGPDTLVGVAVGRSIEQVVTVLAIWKAGGAFVPLDPAHPPERLAAMLADTEVSILVARRRWRPPGSLPAGARVVCLDALPQGGDGHGGADFPPVTVPDNLAYVVYTSGSTGRPKGVMTTHLGAVNYLQAVTRLYRLGPGDAVLQLPSLMFDAAVRDLIGPLTVGARVVLVAPDEATNPAAILAALDQHAVTCILSIVPTMLRAVVAEAPSGRRHGLQVRLLVVSGERLGWEDVRRARMALGREGLSVINQYGPTETTMTASFHVIAPGQDGQGEVPIGRPIANTSLWILGSDLRPVPDGVPGELHIGGAGLARGYLRRPGLTAERFGPDPLGRPGSRRYRTGDRVRRLPGGELQFLGRLDRQVKIRGNRVEPAEIEQALCGLAAVRDAGVVARPGPGGEAELVACVVPGQEGLPDAATLRAALRARLPDAMVPTRVVWVSALPRTPNGKLDREALPALAAEASAAAGRYCAPRTRLELEMAAIWEDVLGIRPVGVLDNFFDLGGHSLTAVVLVERIARQLGARLPLTVLFQRPTVADLCEEVKAPAAQRTCLIQLRAATPNVQPPLVLVHPQSGEVFCYLPLVHALPPEIAVLALQAVGYDSDEPPLATIEAMADRYVAELRRVVPSGPYELAGWSFGANVAAEMARQLEAAGQRVGFLGLLDARAFGASGSPATAAGGLAGFASTLGLTEGMPLDEDEEHALAVLLRQAKHRNLLRPTAETPTLRRMIEVFNANGAAAARYHPTGPVAAELDLFQATETHPSLPCPPVEAEAWEARTSGRLRVHPVQSNHYDLLSLPQVRELAALLTAALQRP